jgi:hypothetical protein
MLPIDKIKEKLPNARFINGTCQTRCPAHNDRNPSLTIRTIENGVVLVKCHAGCTTEKVMEELGLKMSDLFPIGDVHKGGGRNPQKKSAMVQPGEKSLSNDGKYGLHNSGQPSETLHLDEGCTLRAYAEAKQLPEDFLRELGLSEITYKGQIAVRIPYRDENNNQGPTRFRLTNGETKTGGSRFEWKKGSKPTRYGIWARHPCLRSPWRK